MTHHGFIKNFGPAVLPRTGICRLGFRDCGLAKKEHHISPNSFGHPDMLGQLFICAGQILAGHLHPLNLHHFVAFLLLLKKTTTSNGPFLKTQMTHTVQQKPFRTYLRCVSLFIQHLQSNWVTINLPKG